MRDAESTQLNLPLDSEIGTLARLCRDLAHGGVNLLALSAPEPGPEQGVVRLLVANRAIAERALTQSGYLFAVEEVLFIDMKNEPGATRTHRIAVVLAAQNADLDRAMELLA